MSISVKAHWSFVIFVYTLLVEIWKVVLYLYLVFHFIIWSFMFLVLFSLII